MTLEEVYSNSVKCQELSTERTKNELRLEELYENGENLPNNIFYKIKRQERKECIPWQHSFLSCSFIIFLLFSKQNTQIFYRSKIRFLSFISHTEHSYYTRTCMTSYHCSDIVDQNIFNTHLLTYKLRHIFRIFDTVSVSNHNQIILPAF